MSEPLHLIKLSVGSESVASLTKWQATRAAQARDGLPRHVTRMWPRREAELLDGGSIYWVIRGFIRVRQRIVRLDEADLGDGIRRCAIVLGSGARLDRGHATSSVPGLALSPGGGCAR